jgi:homoserine kinase type II
VAAGEAAEVGRAGSEPHRLNPLLERFIKPAMHSLTETDLRDILAGYDLGVYQGSKRFTHGAVQTTLLIETSAGLAVLRVYENRSIEHVRFEIRALCFLRDAGLPVPAVIKNVAGDDTGIHRGKPFVIVEYIAGAQGSNPNLTFVQQEAIAVVKAVAHLHLATMNLPPDHFGERTPLNVAYCWKEFQARHPHWIDNEKGRWFVRELETIELPPALPHGLCHADLNHGNFLFRDGDVVAMLDFDMSFIGPLVYDVADLIYWWAWPPGMPMKPAEAALLVNEYAALRPLRDDEKGHIYDALKLITLLGLSWSDDSDYEETKWRIDCLNDMGRTGFLKALGLAG